MSISQVKDFSSFRKFCERIGQNAPLRLESDKPVWIFGAGQFGCDVFSILRNDGFHVQGFIESNPREERVLGLPALSWSQLQSGDLEAQLVIGIFNRGMPLDELAALAESAGYTRIFMPWDIYSQFGRQLGWRFWLSSPNIIHENLSAIEKTYNILADQESRQCLFEICAFRLGQHNAYAGFRHPEQQYYNELTLDALRGRSISYIDGGAFNGDTFIDLCGHADVKDAYLFEPDPENYNALVNAVENASRPALCLPLALADRYRMLTFTGGKGEGASISGDGTIHVAAAALDEMFPGCSIDFIKLDVEGAEADAINGALQLIKGSRPIIAVSLYHKAQDLWEIPYQLSFVCKDYRFYIRQHYYNSFATVLYAIPECKKVI
jgi:FkbM family methyltransferase